MASKTWEQRYNPNLHDFKVSGLYLLASLKGKFQHGGCEEGAMWKWNAFIGAPDGDQFFDFKEPPTF